MTSGDGPFFSTLDADSEGVEGKFYVWTEKEILDLLGPEDGPLFNAVYGVEAGGNWEHGQNILHRGQAFAESARLHHLGAKELRERLDRGRRQLYEVRAGASGPAAMRRC